jgi:hypothetical protein
MGLSDALVEPVDLSLHRMQLRDDRLTSKACVTWRPLIATLRHGRNQLLQSFTSLCRHQTEFGQVGTKCVDQLSPLWPRTASQIAAASAASFLPRFT